VATPEQTFEDILGLVKQLTPVQKLRLIEATLMQPELFDVVGLLVDVPDRSLRAGDRGAIVECYPDSACEVEFTNDAGETTALCSLSSEQFLVIWRVQIGHGVTLHPRSVPRLPGG
jgi:hypothetical protein